MIDKIPNNDKFNRDNTLNFVNPSNVNVLGYRFVTIGDEASYLFIGFYDAASAVPNATLLKSMTDDNLDYLTASLDVIIRRFTALKIPYYDLVPKEKEVKKPSVVTIMYTDIDYNKYVYNCIMGMGDIDFIVPICIHGLIKLRDIEDNNYLGYMSILQRTVYNYMTVKSEWEKIMKLQGYEDGLIIDDSEVVKNFIDTVYPNCYKEIQLKS